MTHTTHAYRAAMLRAVGLVIDDGYTQAGAARLVGMRQNTLSEWLREVRAGRPLPGLPGRKRIAREAALVRRAGRCDLCDVILGRDGQTWDEGESETMPWAPHTDPRESRCIDCRVLYGDGPAEVILACWGISAANEGMGIDREVAVEYNGCRSGWRPVLRG